MALLLSPLNGSSSTLSRDPAKSRHWIGDQQHLNPSPGLRCTFIELPLDLSPVFFFPMHRGTKRTYILPELQDLDQIAEVHLQHRPSAMAMSRDWSPQHVEVCNEGNGRTFFFLAGQIVMLRNSGINLILTSSHFEFYQGLVQTGFLS